MDNKEEEKKCSSVIHTSIVRNSNVMEYLKCSSTFIILLDNKELRNRLCTADCIAIKTLSLMFLLVKRSRVVNEAKK